MTKEDTIIFIVFVMVLIVGYNLFKAFWNNKPLVEGLANMSLAGNSKAVVESIKSKNEAIGNEVLLNNPEYKQNYEDICTELYDSVNLKLVKKMLSLDPTGDDAAFIKGLTDLNTLYQSKAALNDTLSFMETVKTNKK
jgi:hypothetical protein